MSCRRLLSGALPPCSAMPAPKDVEASQARREGVVPKC